MSQTTFAKQIGMSQSNVSKIINGDPRAPGPPLDSWERWAEVLKISEEKRDSFRRLVLLAHAHEEIRELVMGLESQLALEQERYASLLKQHALPIKERRKSKGARRII
jgi:transcriptional regulator with XRE-family HTH domain